MKAKYLLDECNGNKSFRGGLFIRSVDLVGQGASDEEVLKLSKSLKIPIVTSDKKFVLNILLDSNPVIYKCKNKTTMIIPKVIHDQRFSDPVTHYILDSQNVIRA